MTGKQIKKRRLALQLTREELAQLIGVRAMTIYRWETDRQKPDTQSQRILEQELSKLERRSRAS